MILRAWVDDSGDENIFAVGGLVSVIENWDGFSADWKTICKKQPAIGVYKTNHALGLKNEFNGFSAAARNSKVANLAQVIPSMDCFGLSESLPQKAFDELIKGKTHSPRTNPYFICAFFLVMRTLVAFSHQAGKIDFAFDKQGTIGEAFKLFMDVCIAPFFPELGEICFLNNEEFPPLQAADMYAAWTRRIASPNPMWTAADRFLKKIPPLTPEHKITRDDLEKFSSMDKRIPSLDEFRETVRAIRAVAKS